MGTLIVNQYLNKLWTPTELGSKVGLWIDPSESSTLSLSGSVVTAIDDKSGNGYNLTASGTPELVNNALNGRPTITVVLGEFLENTTSSLFRNVGSGYWVVIGKYPVGATFANNAMLAYTSNGAVAAQTRIGLTSQATSGGTAGKLSVSGRRLDTDSYIAYSSSTSRIEGSYFIEVGQFDWSNGRARHWTNGVNDLDAVTNFINGTGNTSDTNPVQIAVLSGGGLHSPTGTELAIAMAIEGELTTTELQKLEGYLAHLWGLTANLPITHPYKNTPPYV